MSRRLVLRAPGDLRIEPAPTPAPAPDEVVIRPTAVGICGSDVHGYAGRTARRPPGVVMGHEVAGRVVALGSAITDLAPGTAVAINPVWTCGTCARCRAGHDNLCSRRRLYGCDPELAGGFGDAMAVRRRNVVALPDELPVEVGALAEPLAVGTHAVALAAPSAGDAVLVIGGGTIGIAAALAARHAGVARVTVSEPDHHRAAILQALGLESTPPDAVAPASVDIAFECVGLGSPLAAAFRAVRPGGAIVAVGLAAATVPIPSAALVMEERRLLGSAVYTRREFEATIARLAGGESLAPMIERRVQLAELPATFAAYAEGRERAVKTIMTPA